MIPVSLYRKIVVVTHSALRLEYQYNRTLDSWNGTYQLEFVHINEQMPEKYFLTVLAQTLLNSESDKPSVRLEKSHAEPCLGEGKQLHYVSISSKIILI